MNSLYTVDSSDDPELALDERNRPAWSSPLPLVFGGFFWSLRSILHLQSPSPLTSFYIILPPSPVPLLVPIAHLRFLRGESPAAASPAANGRALLFLTPSQTSPSPDCQPPITEAARGSCWFFSWREAPSFCMLAGPPTDIQFRPSCLS